MRAHNETQNNKSIFFNYLPLSKVFFRASDRSPHVNSITPLFHHDTSPHHEKREIFPSREKMLAFPQVIAEVTHPATIIKSPQHSATTTTDRSSNYNRARPDKLNRSIRHDNVTWDIAELLDASNVGSMLIFRVLI